MNRSLRIFNNQTLAFKRAYTTVSSGLQEHSAEQLSAFEHRIGVYFKQKEIITQALTHKSFDHARTLTNERLEWLGKRVINLYAGELLEGKYPELNSEELQDLFQSHFGEKSMSQISFHLGLQHLVRWKSASRTDLTSKLEGQNKVLGKSFQALVGAIYSDQGAVAAKSFVEKHVLDQKIDVNLVKLLDQPKRRLLALAARKKTGDISSRVLSESSKFTPIPTYIVGLFIGSRKIAEGHGSSIKTAESKAAKDALVRHFKNDSRDFDFESIVSTPEEEISFPPVE